MRLWLEQLSVWLMPLRLRAPGTVENVHLDGVLSEETARLRLYTDRHVYSIVAKENYLGCVMSNRAPLPGEDWTRGSDLADGPFSEDTWRRILSDIIATELHPIAPAYTPTAVTPEDGYVPTGRPPVRGHRAR